MINTILIVIMWRHNLHKSKHLTKQVCLCSRPSHSTDIFRRQTQIFQSPKIINCVFFRENDVTVCIPEQEIRIPKLPKKYLSILFSKEDFRSFNLVFFCFAAVMYFKLLFEFWIKKKFKVVGKVRKAWIMLFTQQTSIWFNKKNYCVKIF